MSRTAVVVPAAGSGTRMGRSSGVPKQLRLLGGAPLLVQTLRRFARHPEVGALVVAVPEAERVVVEAMLEAGGVAAEVVAGGATRQESVGHGLEALPESVGIVLVHDAVRPFVTAEQITAVVEAVRAGGAAALAVPVADTLRHVTDGLFGETVERAGLWRMQTPQAARLDWLREAHERAARDGFTGTDEVALLRRSGRPVVLVAGDERNLKLTHPADWALAEALWMRQEEGGEGQE